MAKQQTFVPTQQKTRVLSKQKTGRLPAAGKGQTSVGETSRMSDGEGRNV